MSYSTLKLKGPVEVKIWTNSQGHALRQLPHQLALEFTPNQCIRFPFIDCRPNRQWNNTFFNEFENDFNDLSLTGQQRLSIIFLGDSEIREKPEIASTRIVNWAKKLVQMHENSDNLLVILGLLPLPGVMQKIVDCAEKTDEELAKVVALSTDRALATTLKIRSSFVKVSHGFCDQTTGLVMENPYFEPDRNRLSTAGAKRLAQIILTTSMHLVRVATGQFLPSTPPYFSINQN